MPPDINTLLDAPNRRAAGDPAGQPEDRRSTRPTRRSAGWARSCPGFVKGGTTLAIDARKNLDPLTALIDQSQPVLDSQTETADPIQAWASHLATITEQLQTQDAAVAGVSSRRAARRCR